ncbi:zinc-ribbon domain-containing protein [Microbacterium sp. NPDC078814]|uniref:zinc-ribbon domain-containing protein n=1 Tax=Microbacterium sp. NPDC078814 TaxID=3154767 RepID=UPI00345110A3
MTTDQAWAIRPKWHRYESPRSYARRQCAAAQVPVDVVERGLTSRRQPNYKRVWSDPLTPAVIEAAAGRPAGHVDRLTRRAQPAEGDYAARYLCRLCAAGEIVEQIPHDRENWCLKHPGQMVWTGPGTTPETQLVTRFDPAQARAERRFRRMVAAGRITPRLHTRAWEMVRDNANLSDAQPPSRDTADDETATRARLYPHLVAVLEELTSPRHVARWKSCPPEHLRAEIARSLTHIPGNIDVLITRIILWLRPMRRQIVATRLQPLDVALDTVDAPAVIDTHAIYPRWIQQHPQAVAEWDWTRNDDARDPWSAAAVSRKAWWVCDDGHSWETSPFVRGAALSGCPYCAGMDVWPGQTDLRTLFPDIAAEWATDPGVNAGTPDTVSATAGRVITWLCPDGHAWRTSVAQRTKNRVRCRVCSNQSVQIGMNDLSTTHPHLVASWSPTNARTPEQVVAGSDYTAAWTCPDGHGWVATVRSRAVDETGCPTCTSRRVTPGFNDLASKHHRLASEWDARPAANDRGPSEVTVKSSYLAGWRCPRGHTWRATVANRYTGSGCPSCSGHTAVRGHTDLATRRPDLALEWGEGNDRTADQVTVSSHYMATWTCRASHSHVWSSTVKNRSAGSGCPVCTGKRPETGVNDLATLRPDLAAEWDDSNEFSPADVTIGSGRKATWRCGPSGHVWTTIIQSRTRRTGAHCPLCITEREPSGRGRAA